MEVHGPKNKHIWVPQNSDICHVEKKSGEEERYRRVYTNTLPFASRGMYTFLCLSTHRIALENPRN